VTNSSLARRSNLFREEVADRVFNAGSFEPEYDDEDFGARVKSSDIRPRRDIQGRSSYASAGAKQPKRGRTTFVQSRLS